MSSCSCGARLVYRAVCSCSGAADTGCIADHAARLISARKLAKMSCAAAIAAGDEEISNWTVASEHVLVIDGCEKNCAKKILESWGFTDLLHVRVTDLGMEKGKTPVTDEAVEKVVAHAVALFPAKKK
ncbi:MAG: putative zinc-binding protein [Candidatus Sumerlaeaceae bacterium]